MPETQAESAAAPDLDTIMQSASELLAKMDYIGCESACADALKIAKQRRDWSYYRRILMPLQESRRQRRMIAADAHVRLGTFPTDASGASSEKPDFQFLKNILGEVDAGCLVVTTPFTPQAAARLNTAARENQRYFEIICATPLANTNADANTNTNTNTNADADADANTNTDANANTNANATAWQIALWNQPDRSIVLPPPPYNFCNKWLSASAPIADHTFEGATPAHWFVQATEKLGDTAVAHGMTLNPTERLDYFEHCLDALTDHEILHQRLWDTAAELA